MSQFAVIATLLLLSLLGFRIGRGRAGALAARTGQRLRARPVHYGAYLGFWCGIPGFLVFALAVIVEPMVARWLIAGSLPPSLADMDPARAGLLIDTLIRRFGTGGPVGDLGPEQQRLLAHYQTLRDIGWWLTLALTAGAAATGFAMGWRRLTPGLRARNAVEATVKAILAASSSVAVLITIGIVLSLLVEAIRFFRLVPLDDFLFGLSWSPQTAIRADQIGSSGSFGAVPLFAGTLLITLVAMVVAVPLGLLSAIYISEYASPRLRAATKPMLEVLAGIPTVVYGFFAALVVAPLLRDMGASLGLDVASESALAAGVVMGVMIIPFMSSISDDVLQAVPSGLRDGSLALGATRSETVKRVLMPAAMHGIMAGFLLAMSRAIGETMIVVMAAGLAANLTANPLQAVTTVTVQITTLLVGDQEFDSAKTLAAFALGLALFCATLILNVISFHVVRRYQQRYD